MLIGLAILALILFILAPEAFGGMVGRLLGFLFFTALPVCAFYAVLWWALT